MLVLIENYSAEDVLICEHHGSHDFCCFRRSFLLRQVKRNTNEKGKSSRKMTKSLLMRSVMSSLVARCRCTYLKLRSLLVCPALLCFRCLDKIEMTRRGETSKNKRQHRSITAAHRHIPISSNPLRTRLFRYLYLFVFDSLSLGVAAAKTSGCLPNTVLSAQ